MILDTSLAQNNDLVKKLQTHFDFDLRRTAGGPAPGGRGGGILGVDFAEIKKWPGGPMRSKKVSNRM